MCPNAAIPFSRLHYESRLQQRQNVKRKKEKRVVAYFQPFFFFLHVCSGRQREGEGGAAGRLRGAAEQDNTEGETSNKTLQITEAPPSETLARQESDPRGKSQLYFSYMVFGCEIRGSQSLPKNKADRGGGGGCSRVGVEVKHLKCLHSITENPLLSLSKV